MPAACSLITVQCDLLLATILNSMVRLLGTRDEDLIEDEDDLGNKPLHLAATEGHSEVVEVLLELGAAVDGR